MKTQQVVDRILGSPTIWAPTFDVHDCHSPCTPLGKRTSRAWAFKAKGVSLGVSAPIGANWYT